MYYVLFISIDSNVALIRLSTLPFCELCFVNVTDRVEQTQRESFWAEKLTIFVSLGFKIRDF